MVLCKSYAEKLSCQKFKVCPDEHINVKQCVKAEMEAAINGHQWPLSCFGPFSDKPSVPNYIEDQSFEEIRFMYYNSDKYSFFESCQKFREAISDAKDKMQLLNAMNREVVDVLINVYDYVEPLAKVKYLEPSPVWRAVANPPAPARNMYKVSFPPPPPNPIFSAFPKDGELKKFNFGFGSPPGKSGEQANEKKDAKTGFFSSPVKPANLHEKREKTSSIFSGTNLLKLPDKQEKFTGFFSSEQLQKLQANAFRAKTSEEAATQTAFKNEECKDCKENFKDLLAKMDAILDAVKENKTKAKEQEENINSLMDSMKQISIGKETTKQKRNCVTGNEPAIRIKPKFKQSSDKTKEEIKNTLSPLGYFNSGFQISAMMKSTQGSIIVKCKNAASMNKIEEEISKNCSENYSTEVLKLAMPKLLVNGIDFDIGEGTLVDIIKKQNQIEGHVNLVRSFERENVHKYNAILEVDKNVYWSIMRNSEPHLYVGWSKCVVFENIEIKRCYKCWGYNHHSRRCRNERRCPRCAGQHSENDCTANKLRCANCSMANIKLNLKLDLEHDVRNYHCYVYLSKIEMERKMIDY